LETDRLNLKWLTIALAVATLIGGFALAMFHPGYIGDLNNLGAVLVVELLLVCAWHYQQLFFPLLMITFVWAGTGFPFSGAWQTARWGVLAAGAFLGFVLWLRARRLYLRAFHYFFFAGVCAALASALSSPYPTVALLKVFSLFLLFLYGAMGARLAISARYKTFIPHFVTGCEIALWTITAAVLVIGGGVFGNQNSIGAIMGVCLFPPLLWGSLVATTPGVRRRRVLALGICTILLCSSLARAGMLAALVSAVVLLVTLRRYKLLVAFACAASAALAIASFVAPASINELTSSMVYKQNSRETGILQSRRSVWRQTMSSIEQHPWFGSGFGTTADGDAWNRVYVTTTSEINREHGNSYLEMLEWLGVLGILPFAAVILLLLRQVARVCLWMRRTGSALHPAAPLAAVVVAGLVHAIFEDWLLAVGYYLTVFFWPLAFSLMDLGPQKLFAPAPMPANVLKTPVPLFAKRQPDMRTVQS
jgi:O-Antigen ligase